MPVRVEGVDAAIEQIKADISKIVREFGITLFQGLVSITPIDTGYARGNWLIDFGRENLRTVGSRDSPPGAPTGGQVATWRIDSGSLVFHNSVEYITELDRGSSGQAPQGMVDPAIAAAIGRFGR